MIAAGILLFFLLQTQDASLRVSAIQGAAEVVRQGAATPARTGDSLLAGDQLRTQPNSLAIFFTEDGSTFQLGAEGNVEVRRIETEPALSLTGGSLKVATGGETVNIETRFGRFILSDSTELEMTYAGDVLEVAVGRGSFKTSSLEADKVVFKSVTEPGFRVHEAGEGRQGDGRVPEQPPVIIVPRVVVPR